VSKPDAELEELLTDGLTELGLAPGPALVAALANYVRLLTKWNQAYNLTSVRDPREMVARHILDSLSARPCLVGLTVLDVGTGAGLPGLPLALAEPARQFWLMDSGLKKARFVRHAVAELGLKNAAVEHCRVEDYEAGQGFDTLITRALCGLGDFVERCGRLVAAGGRLVAMKGRYPEDELRRLPSEWCASVERVSVPGLVAERHLVVLERR